MCITKIKPVIASVPKKVIFSGGEGVLSNYSLLARLALFFSWKEERARQQKNQYLPHIADNSMI